MLICKDKKILLINIRDICFFINNVLQHNYYE